MRSAGCLILYSGLCVLVVLPSAKVQVARIIRHPSDLSLFSCLSSPSFRFSAYDVSCWIGRADRGLFSVMGMAAAQRRPLNCQDSLWHTFVFMLGQAFVSSNANWLWSYYAAFEQHSNDRNYYCAELANARPCGRLHKLLRRVLKVRKLFIFLQSWSLLFKARYVKR